VSEVRSFAELTQIKWDKTNAPLARRTSGARCNPPALFLEDDLHPELEDSRFEGRSDLAKFTVARLVLTSWNWVWFHVLKLSARNSSRLPRVSLKRKLLKSDMFQLSRPGPRRALWPSVPKAPTAGAVNAVVSNHWPTVCG